MHLEIKFNGAVERPASMTKLDTFQVYKDDSIHSQLNVSYWKTLGQKSYYHLNGYRTRFLQCQKIPS